MNLSKKSENNAVIIGKVLKPRGLAGEVKCQILTNKREVFCAGENLLIGKLPFKVKGWQSAGLTGYLKLKGIDTIADAERLRGHEITIPREQMPLYADEILSDELLGFNVVGQDGRKLGVVKAVDNNIDCGNFAFPYEDAFVIETNMSEKKIVIREGMLAEEEIFG